MLLNMPLTLVNFITTLKHPLHQSSIVIIVFTIIKHPSDPSFTTTFIIISLTVIPHPRHCHQHPKNALPFTLSPGGTLETIRYPQSPRWSCLYQRGEVCVGKGRPGVPLLACVWPSPASGSGSVIFQG